MKILGCEIYLNVHARARTPTDAGDLQIQRTGTQPLQNTTTLLPVRPPVPQVPEHNQYDGGAGVEGCTPPRHEGRRCCEKVSRCQLFYCDPARGQTLDNWLHIRTLHLY